MLYGSIPEGLCNHATINRGSAKQNGCAGILCPRGTTGGFAAAAATEKQRATSCTPCPPGKTNMYLGSTKCRKFTNRDILILLYEVMEGSTTWDPQYRDSGWGTEDQSLCEWAGITCGESDGKEEHSIIGIEMPLPSPAVHS